MSTRIDYKIVDYTAEEVDNLLGSIGNGSVNGGEVYVGNSEPQDTKIKVWIDTSEDNVSEFYTQNKFRGKIWTALGDSLTMTTSSNSILHTPNGRGYLYWVNQKLGFGKINNLGLDSSTISTVTTNPKNFIQRLPNIPRDSDLITVFGGYNDMWNNNASLGSINSTDTATIYGALNYIAEYLIKYYPNADIVFFTMLHWTWQRSGYAANSGPYNRTSKGLTSASLNQAIRDVGQKYSIPIVDLEKNSGIFPGTYDKSTGTVVKTNHFSKYTYDGLHLNEEGHRRISNKIISTLLSL